MNIRHINESETEKWLSMVANTFGNENPTDVMRDYFRRHLENDEGSELKGIFVAVENNAILSTLRVFKRKINLFGNVVPAGALGEVSTRPEVRGQGLSSKLITAAIDYMKNNRLNVSTLQTGIHRHYERYGWMKVPAEKKITDLRTAKANMDGIYIRKVQWDTDIPVMEGIHNAYGLKHNGIFARKNYSYWEKWIKSEAGEYAFMIILNTGMPAGYIITGENGEDCLSVKEFCTISGYENIFDSAMAKYIAATGTTASKLRLNADITTDMTLIESFTDNGNMIRLNIPFSDIVSTEQLADKIKDEGFYFHETDAY